MQLSNKNYNKIDVCLGHDSIVGARSISAEKIGNCQWGVKSEKMTE